MKLYITIKQQNPDFDKKYADQYHWGEESENNTKDLWSEEYELSREIDKISITGKSLFHIYGKDQDGKEINIMLENMTVLEGIVGSETITTFAVSKNLIKKTHKAYNNKYDTTRFYFYLKNRDDFQKLTNQIYVLKEDLPEKIINQLN